VHSKTLKASVDHEAQKSTILKYAFSHPFLSFNTKERWISSFNTIYPRYRGYLYASPYNLWPVRIDRSFFSDFKAAEIQFFLQYAIIMEHFSKD
jgi:hypothetical protein